MLFIDQSINNGFLVFSKERQKLYLNLADLGLQVVLLLIGASIFIELTVFITLFVLVKVLASVLRIGYVSYIAFQHARLDRTE